MSERKELDRKRTRFAYLIRAERRWTSRELLLLTMLVVGEKSLDERGGEKEKSQNERGNWPEWPASPPESSSSCYCTLVLIDKQSKH